MTDVQLLSCRCRAPPVSDGWRCRYVHCHLGVLTFLLCMLAPLGPVIMAVIQVLEVSIRKPRTAKPSGKEDTRTEKGQSTRGQRRVYCTDAYFTIKVNLSIIGLVTCFSRNNSLCVIELKFIIFTLITLFLQETKMWYWHLGEGEKRWVSWELTETFYTENLYLSLCTSFSGLQSEAAVSGLYLCLQRLIFLQKPPHAVCSM